MNSHTLHARPVFANSALEAGRRIEQLRLRRVALRGRERQALLAEESATRAAEHAVQAEQAAAGRKLAGLASDDAVTRARAATKAANRVKRDRLRQAAELGSAVTAIEAEIDAILTEHRTELEMEAREAFAAQADSALRAGEQLQRSLALLRESAGAAFALHAALGNDTSLIPPTDQIQRLERTVAELVGQVPAGLMEAAEQDDTVTGVPDLSKLLASADDLRVEALAQPPWCARPAVDTVQMTYDVATERGYDILPVDEPPQISSIIARSELRDATSWEAVLARREPLTPERLVAREAPVLRLLDRLERHQILFTLGRTGVDGVVTIYDLNQPAAHLLGFGMALICEADVTRALRAELGEDPNIAYDRANRVLQGSSRRLAA